MRYDFGPFRLDTDARVLTRGGAEVPLFPKVLETLTVLVSSGGEVLSKEELIRRVWPDTFVQESNLSQNVFILRKTLGEEWIETVPRRGYRFAGQVRTADEEEILVARRTTVRIVSETVTRRPLATRIAVAAGGLAVLAGVGFGIGRAFRSEQATPSPVVRARALSISRLTHDSNAFDPAISPDGKLVAYKSVTGDETSVWLKDLSRGSAIRVLPPSREDYRSLVFARDGSELLFRSYPRDAKNGAVMRVPIFGGAPQEFARDIWSDFSLSPDGREIAFLRGSARSEGVAVVVARIDGGGERTVGRSVYQKTWFALWESAPAWSPDGKRLAICGWSREQEQDRPALFEMNVADGSTREVSIPPEWSSVSQVAWLAEGQRLMVAAEKTGAAPTQLWMLEYGSGRARRVTNDVTDYRKIRLSSDSRLLVAEQQIRYDHMWLVRDGAAKQLTFGVDDGDGYSGVSWTRDGSVLFVSDRTGSSEMWSMRPDGSDVRPLTAASTFSNAWPRATPDGRYVLIASNRTGRWNIWRLDRDGRNPLQLTHGEAETRPEPSPDGRWVWYTNTAVVPARIEKVPIDGGSPVGVPAEGSASHGQPSPDGEWVAYATYDDRRGWHHAVMPARGGATRVFDWSSVRGSVEWTPDSKGLIYVSGANLWLQPVPAGAPRKLTDFDAEPIWNFALAPDGKSFVVVRGQALSDIVLMRDFGG